MVNRIKPDIYKGLTEEQIQDRIKSNLQHKDTSIKTKSIKHIVSSNVITLFNIINLTLGFFVFYTGSYKNLLFLGVAFCNTIISLSQEIHAKKIIDRLSVIASTRVTLIRNGEEKQHNMEEIVLDDVIKYKTGDQIVVDSIIKKGTVEADESFITGESDYVVKNEGDVLLSGSFIVSGNCIALVEHISDDNYVNKISAHAKYIKKTNSVIFNTIKKIIKVISVIIIPLGILLFIQQRNVTGNTIDDSILNTVAALISMIPEGLVLLTSTVLAVGAIRLARNRVLIQELYCIETLARVDTICLDKTGTITTGNMKVEDTVVIDESYPVQDILTAISFYNSDTNATAMALKEHYAGETKYELSEQISFSSARKYSGMEFKGKGKYLIGAPEFLTVDKKVLQTVKKYSDFRVLLLAHEKKDTSKAIALILIKDIIRNNAVETLEYFADQDVDVKIISGDNISTIEKIAMAVDMKNIKSFDMSKIKKEQKLEDLVYNYNVFGRVTPMQKKELILAIKKNGHIVAMTGDGVNDVLALKEADCSIALSCGSDAAKSVSQLVLLDSDFASVPRIVNEGRRAINNLERSATLFLTKTVYATLLAIIFLFIQASYPFDPIQLTLNSVTVIGIPSFILAMEANNERIKGNFIINVIGKSIPAALTIVTNIVGVIFLGQWFNWGPQYVSTMSLILLGFAGFMLLFKICCPFNRLRGILFGTLIGIFLGGTIGLQSVFDLVTLTPHMFIILGILFVADIILFQIFTHICERKIFKYKERIIG